MRLRRVTGLQRYYYTLSAYIFYGKTSCVRASFVSILQLRAGLPGKEGGESDPKLSPRPCVQEGRTDLAAQAANSILVSSAAGAFA